MRRSIRDFLDSSDCEAVVHGTLDPVGRTITHEALERNRDVYHIPHSIATTYPPNPQPTVTQFVAGSMDVRYYQRVVPEDQQWEWVPLGRPYLADLSERYADNEHRAAPDDRIRVVVATVTAPRDVREEFIETVLDAMDADRFSVVIKPHPDESHDLYDRVKKAYAGVRVISGGLYEEILDADLTITLNSNVGLESMVIGTPAVCYNEWAPLVLEQSYAFSDDVPVFRSPSELESFTSKIDRDGLSSVSIRQERFVKENYRLDPAITEDIARYIETGGASKPTEGSS